jgi:hypothetical protein
MTFFCGWVGTYDDDIRAYPPPPRKNPNNWHSVCQKIVARCMPIGEGRNVRCVGGCGTPRAYPIDQPPNQQPNQTSWQNPFVTIVTNPGFLSISPNLSLQLSTNGLGCIHQQQTRDLQMEFDDFNCGIITGIFISIVFAVLIADFMNAIN